MNRSRLPSLAVTIAGLAVVAVAAIGYGAAAAGDPGSSPAPSAPASPAPVQPTPPPSQDPESPIVVDLETADGHDVSVEIVDELGRIVGAETGHPGDGMSVEPSTLQVENVDEDTLRLTWVDFALDREVKLHLIQGQEELFLVLIQPEAPDATDAMGFDRVLLVDFDGPISADEISPFLQEGFDTPGDAAA